jgi:hypothetical protein
MQMIVVAISFYTLCSVLVVHASCLLVAQITNTPHLLASKRTEYSLWTSGDS